MNDIFFNQSKHKYTNEFGIPYISSTQLKGLYVPKFDTKGMARACEKIGRNPRHEKYQKYKGKSAQQIINEWEHEAKKGKDRGNEEHDYLETNIKLSTGFYSVFPNRYKDSKEELIKLYTIDDIRNNIVDGFLFGKLNISYFEKVGIKDKYPEIYDILVLFANDGWSIYSEVCAYNTRFLISGLIDILLIKGEEFVVLDWKTNKADIRFEAGYWEKDLQGNISNYKKTNNTLKYPLNTLGHSTGNEYAIQISIYAWLIEQFGFKNMMNILCHITHDTYNSSNCDNPSLYGKTRVNSLQIPYLKNNVETMISHYSTNKQHILSYGN